MNFALLYSIRDYCSNYLCWWRELAGAFVGVIYVFLLLAFSGNILYSFFIKFLISLVMVYIAYSIKTVKELVKAIILFYISAFIMGGTIIGEFYFLNQHFTVYNNAFLLQNLNPLFLVTGALISIILVKLSFSFFINYHYSNRNKIDIRIYENNGCVKLKALIDTGNTLRDPYTNKPVVIIYYKSIQKLLPIELTTILNNISSKEFSWELSEISKLNDKKIRVLSYRTLGKENGKLIAIEVDTLETYIMGNKGDKKNRQLPNVTVALYERPLCENSDYEAIISPDLLCGGY